MDSSVSAKDEICFLHVSHHISNALYVLLGGVGGRLSLFGSRAEDLLFAVFS